MEIKKFYFENEDFGKRTTKNTIKTWITILKLNFITWKWNFRKKRFGTKNSLTLKRLWKITLRMLRF
jgi:hypothetical protein